MLCGSDIDAVTSRRHHELTHVRRCCATRRSPEVRGYIEQLIAHGFLRQTDDAFPVVALTERGVGLLKDPDSRGRISCSRASAGR